MYCYVSEFLFQNQKKIKKNQKKIKKPEKNKNTVDIESGTCYTYGVIQIKTCYLI